MHIGNIGELKQTSYENIPFSGIRHLFKLKSNLLERQPNTDMFINQSGNSGIKLKTVLTLYSNEFNPSRRVAENGAKITTIIDKKTQKPVEVFVEKIEDEDPLCERYYIMLKDKSGDINFGDENYKRAGLIYFYLNPDKQMITPKFEKVSTDNITHEQIRSYMVADENKDYGGIGIRLHQLRIERMLQEKFNNVMIVAEGNSFPFHYDMGFRLRPDFRPISNNMVNEILSFISDLNGKTPQENMKYLAVRLANGQEMINVSHTIENFLYDHYKNGGAKLKLLPHMYLDETAKGQWVELIKRQPILL